MSLGKDVVAGTFWETALFNHSEEGSWISMYAYLWSEQYRLCCFFANMCVYTLYLCVCVYMYIYSTYIIQIHTYSTIYHFNYYEEHNTNPIPFSPILSCCHSTLSFRICLSYAYTNKWTHMVLIPLWIAYFTQHFLGVCLCWVRYQNCPLKLF